MHLHCTVYLQYTLRCILHTRCIAACLYSPHHVHISVHGACAVYNLHNIHHCVLSQFIARSSSRCMCSVYFAPRVPWSVLKLHSTLRVCIAHSRRTGKCSYSVQRRCTVRNALQVHLLCTMDNYFSTLRSYTVYSVSAHCTVACNYNLHYTCTVPLGVQWQCTL